MSFVPFSRARLRDSLWLALFAAGNFIAAGTHGATPSSTPNGAGVSATRDAPSIAAAPSGHSRPHRH